MRIGVKLGPVYASTGTRRRRRGGGGSLIGLIIGLMIMAFVVIWPLILGQKQGGGYHPWTWAIAIPWWIILALIAAGYVVSKNKKVRLSQRKNVTKSTPPNNGHAGFGGNQSDQPYPPVIERSEIPEPGPDPLCGLSQSAAELQSRLLPVPLPDVGARSRSG